MTRRPQENLELIRRILGGEYLQLSIEKFVLEENFETGESQVRVELSTRGSDFRQVVEGRGVGMVDALFHALCSRFAQEYQSLNSIEFASFEIRARLDTKKEKTGADAVGEVVLRVKNSEAKIFEFADASRSIASSTARAVVAAVEYFLNAERAFVALYRGLTDAKERGREDLVQRYTQEMAEVVKSTSYTEVIERIQKGIG